MSLETLVKVTLVIELKEGDTGTELPTSIEIIRRVRDVLTDVTEHDETLGWRVRGVEHTALRDDDTW